MADALGGVADVPPFEELGGEEPLDQGAGIAPFLRAVDQPVRLEGVRARLDLAGSRSAASRRRLPDEAPRTNDIRNNIDRQFAHGFTCSTILPMWALLSIRRWASPA
jgi:hypothetical protein